MGSKKNKLNVYEDSFCKLFCGKAAFGFWKGRVALYAILKAMGIGPDDEIIVPGYTCVVDINPIKYLGAKPVYVDIEPLTFNINTKLLEEKITEKTKIIIAQHTYGYPCDMDDIMDIAGRYGIAVIEDCCLAFGSKYRGRTVGAFGDAAYFSFQWNKFYTTGVGGMALINTVDLADKVKLLYNNEIHRPTAREMTLLFAQLAFYRIFVYPRTTALAQTVFRFLTRKGVVLGSSKYDEYALAPMEKDFFKRMSSIQAESGLRQLQRVEKNIIHRKRMTELYDELLERRGWPMRKYDKSLIDPVMVRYPVRVAEKNNALEEAVKAGIELGNWFNSVLHQIETSLEVYEYKVGMCPEGERAAREVVNLPLHARVNERTVKKTVDFITRYSKVE
jgi:perosamine synthetase